MARLAQQRVFWQYLAFIFASILAWEKFLGRTPNNRSYFYGDASGIDRSDNQCLVVLANLSRESPFQA